ncbi:MAG TPA: FAD-binding oxidoreductase [Streptosporangiaceae bacterium]
MTSQPATGGQPPPAAQPSAAQSPAMQSPAVQSPAVQDALAVVCASLRQGGAADAVAGVKPALVAAPASVAEAAATMRAAAELGLTVVPRGSGSRLSWGLAPDGCDLVIETSGLDRVIEHAHGDWVASVQAGVTLEHLAGVLAGHGQRLMLDVPAPAGGGQGTIGGVLATGMAGPKRLRYGTPRDLLTGLTVVRPDGVVAKSGGKVVKNVAGYDLGKLFAGSFGTLGLIAEATFRLHPVPAAVAYVSNECATAAQAAATVAAAVASPLQPSAVEIDRPVPGGSIGVSVLLEGNPAGVPARVDGMLGLLGDGAAQSGEAPAWWGHGAGDGTLIRVAFWAGALESILGTLDAVAAASGLRPAVGGSAGAGVLYAAIDAQAGPTAVARYVTELRTGAVRIKAGGLPPVRGSVVVLTAPPGVRELVDLWGPVPGAGLMRSVKDQFDPGHRMAPGRFAGGI